jgi:hypothetical protein
MDKKVIKSLIAEFDREDATDQAIIASAQARIDSRRNARLAVLNSLTGEERRSLNDRADRQQPKPQAPEPVKPGRISTNDIRAVMDEMVGRTFTTSEIKRIVEERHPGKTMRRTAVPGYIYILKQEGKLKEISPRSSKGDAVYSLIQ